MLVLAKVILIVSLIFGGAGGTVLAAQGSLPGDALYPIKRLTEEIRIGAAADPQTQIDLHLELAQARVQEMQQLTAQQRAVPDSAPAQLQTHLQTALQQAAHLDNEPLQAALNQIQAHLMTQTQLMTQARLNAPDDRGLRAAEQVLAQMRELAQLGQGDPQQFRARMGANRPVDAPPQPINPPVGQPPRQLSRTPQPAHTPVITHTPALTHTVTPTRTQAGGPVGTPVRTAQPAATPQGNQYGPGPQPTPNQGSQPQPVITPVGSGEGHEFGPGEPQSTPEPQNTPQGPGEPQATPAGSGGSGGGSGKP